MTRIEDIERAVEDLPPEQLAKFRSWFEAFDAACFDQTIESDATSGKLGTAADQALAELRAGRARPL